MARRKETVTERLRRAIRESGLSQGEIHRRSGVAREVICRFLNGRAGLSLPSLDALAEALDLELVEREKTR